MTSSEFSTVTNSTNENSQMKTSGSRRPRPPDLKLESAEGNRVLLRGDKVGRRESKAGFRSIFGRSKAIVKENGGGVGNLASPTTARFAGLRSSVADMGTRPYAQSAPASGLATSPETPERPVSIAIDSSHKSPVSRPMSSLGGKRRTPGGKPVKLGPSPVAEWEAPPLFKAFPQAIRYASLPASTLSTEALSRFSDKKPDLPSPIRDTYDDTTAADKLKMKKRHRRTTSATTSKLEWTTKVYVLVTSGCLLQYAGEGPFDRLPERVLRLGKESAAFASDMIPGKHWVLQISSAIEVETSYVPEQRSLFSKLGFRAVEKRDISTILMVFEGAEEMGGWMTTLRQEISLLGGRASTTETGKPSSSEGATQLRERPSQRTLVLRDSQRISQGLPQDGSWRQSRENGVSGGSINSSEAYTVREASTDDTSTTNSLLSRDGRQLESLRDSAYRLSYLSSGQRTGITSAGSSPACSPTLGSFPAPPTMTMSSPLKVEESFSDVTATTTPQGDKMDFSIHSRPLSGMALSEPGAPRPQATATTSLRPASMVMSNGIVTTPNFSVPASSNRRFSRTASVDFGLLPLQQNDPSEASPRPTLRKSPPSSLRVPRPLSMVSDQPSPREPIPDRPATRHGDSRSVPLLHEGVPVPYTFPKGVILGNSTSKPSGALDIRRLSFAPPQTAPRTNVRPSPRRLSSMGALRKSAEVKPHTMHSHRASIHSNESIDLKGLASIVGGYDDSKKYRSVMEATPRRRTYSPDPYPANKRLSIHSVLSDGSVIQTEIPYVQDLPPPSAPPPSSALPPIPMSTFASSPAAATRNSLLRSDVAGRLPSRRSMPHLAEGPPAPPPSCALPPIPRKLTTTS